MKFTSKTVMLDLIDMDDRAFVVTAGRGIEGLKNSIEVIGLVNPPHLVFSESKGCYRVVCGYRRLEASANLGWKEVPAKVFNSSADEKELFLFALYDNLPHRDFNPVEKAGAVERLLKFFSENEVIETYFPLLGLPASAGAFEDLISLIELEDEIKHGIIQGTITEKNAIRLSGMETDDRLYLFRLFCMVNLSSSKQAEIIESCCDIARRDNLSVRDVLKHEGIEEILKHDKLTLSQQGDRIRQLLRKKRFPRLTLCEERFLRLKKKLALPGSIQFHPPPFFEGSTYRMQIEFENIEDLGRAADQVKILAGSSSVKEMLEEK